MEEKKKTAREIIEGYQGPPVRIMEVCGTHTHEIFRLGIRKLLPPQVELISGPGCPVCVTPVGFIDEAVYLALEKQATICCRCQGRRSQDTYRLFTGRCGKICERTSGGTGGIPFRWF